MWRAASIPCSCAQPAGAGSIIDIDWSPDGAHLAISYYSKTWRRQALYLANADGSDLRLVVQGLGGWHGVVARWDPARLHERHRAGSRPEACRSGRSSADGSAPSLVASQCCVTGGAGVVWSPDGSQIAFETEYGAGTPDVHLEHLVINADGTGDPSGDRRAHCTAAGTAARTSAPATAEALFHDSTRRRPRTDPPETGGSLR